MIRLRCRIVLGRYQVRISTVLVSIMTEHLFRFLCSRLSHNSRSQDRDLNLGPNEHEARVLTTRLQRSVQMQYEKHQRAPLHSCSFTC
jgi:hypothetical protein